MKKKKGPLILIGVLVLLLILYFALSTWNKKQDSKEEETVKVTDLKTSEITGVKYDLGTGEMNFEKDGDTWYYTADKDFPLRQSYPKTVADAMGQLSADRELEDADALEEYGLDHPTYTVTLTDEDGTVTTIKVGNATGNDYYATVDDTEKVYTISATSLDDIQTELDQIVQLDTYPSIGSGNLKKEVITQNGETTTYTEYGTVCGDKRKIHAERLIKRRHIFFQHHFNKLNEYCDYKDKRYRIHILYSERNKQTVVDRIGNKACADHYECNRRTHTY